MHAKQLFVLRHAKSSWDDPGIPDAERPLAPRGRRAAQALHQYLERNAIEPELVLCSSARRARETMDGLMPAGERRIEPELYEADAGELIGRLRRVPGDVRCVMVIGHNPALQVLILRLAGADGGTDVESDLGRIRRKFPTGALAKLEFDCSWGELGPSCARLSALVRPKQLAGS